MHVAQNVPTIIQSVEPFIHKHGYLGIAGFVVLEDFGVLVPGETVLIASAFFAGLGQLNIFLVFVVAVISAIIGDNIGYSIGYYGGHPLINKFGKYVFLKPKHVERAESYFKQKGARIVIVARFIEGLRQLNGILAGLSEMKWIQFLTFNAIGASLWAALWCSVGYFGGNHIAAFLKYDLYLSIAAVIFVAAYFLRLYLKKKKA